MTNKGQRLSLRKETLRRLSGEELGMVAGGSLLYTAACGRVTVASNGCYTGGAGSIVGPGPGPTGPTGTSGG